MIRLIVNADDFGRNEICSRAILEFMEQGLISNTTLMVTEPFAADAMKLAQRSGVLDRVGLHLNLTEGRPLTRDIQNFRMVCGEDGAFNGAFHRFLRSRIYLPLCVRKALRKEIRAQLEKYVALGGSEFHLDSHHHSHTDISVASILFPMAKEIGFKTCRLSRDTAGGAFKSGYKACFNAFARARFRTVDVFTDEKCIESRPGRFEGKTVEIMTHPLRCADGTLDADDKENRGVLEHETTADDLRRFLERLSGCYQMISYGELLK